MQDKAIGQVYRKPGDSYFSTGLLKVKELFLGFDTFNHNNGHNINFWEDIWIDNTTLKQQYPHLYSIVRHKHDTIATIFSSVPLNISFRRLLVGNSLQSWHNLVAMIANVRLNNKEGVFRSLQENNTFTTTKTIIDKAFTVIDK
jgi:hypothetical protein